MFQKDITSWIVTRTWSSKRFVLGMEGEEDGTEREDVDAFDEDDRIRVDSNLRLLVVWLQTIGEELEGKLQSI